MLPFGNRHPASGAMLEEFVPRRLARNVKLHLELAAGRIPVRLVEGGVAHDTGAIPFESAKLYSYFRYVARGLATAHFGRVIPSTYAVSAGLLTKEQDAIMRLLFVKNSNDNARGNLGDGLVLYEGQQAVDDPDLTIWRFLLYGGIVFSGDEQWLSDVCPDIWAVTAKQPMPGLPSV